jgi:hypothetical protein
MLPPFLGALLLLGTVGVVVLSPAVVVWASLKGNSGLARGGLVAAGGMAAVYGLFWILGVVLAPRFTLAPGKGVSFCGLDCHLHVSVAGVHSGAGLGVMVRFSSNARSAPEWPGKLRFRLKDAAGQEYSPINQVPDSALRAGAEWTHELRFPPGTPVDGTVLMVTWGGLLDYLVPGTGNPLAQRQRRLALTPAGGTEAR